ncbi:MAG: Josephin-domain-containing protein [Benniella sp.]|nr:MAG: Josephin-domain-containing protein [Benniella sp.]
MELVPHIFHEQQEGNLCAQHCLNALLQGPYFTAIDLAELARQLDQKEQDALGQSDFGSGSGNPKSQNMDDSGFFSVQVLSHALSIWNIQIIPWGAEEVVTARAEPEREAAFICNLDQHWYTLRRFGPSTECWYDLNSLHPRPQRMSAIYLTMTLSQLEAEGYSIFVVRPLVAIDIPTVDTPEPAVASMPIEKDTATPPPAETSSAPPTFLNERQEMERLRRLRIEERERAAAGDTLPSSSSSSASSSSPAASSSTAPGTATSGPNKRAHVDSDHEASGRKEAKRSPDSHLETHDTETGGTKNQTFSGSGYRLGESSPPPSSVDVSKEDFTFIDEADTEWEMMQQAIAMSLQGHPQ